jgi:hypothetical protein
VVIACAQAPGNPGVGITNAVESIAAQVSNRFAIDPERLVWLEYWSRPAAQWQRVVFHMTGDERLANPEWIPMTGAMWRRLGLQPIGRLHYRDARVPSLLKKMFRTTA